MVAAVSRPTSSCASSVDAAMWRYLVNCGSPWIPSGALLRCKGRYPYESIVDFLVFDAIALADAGFGLLVASGYKAGLVRQILPLESRGQPSTRRVCTWVP